MMYQEIDFCGFYLPPLFLSLLVAGGVFLLLHRFADRIVLQRRVWNRPVFEAAVFLMLLAGVTFILCSTEDLRPSVNLGCGALRILHLPF